MGQRGNTGGMHAQELFHLMIEQTGYTKRELRRIFRVFNKLVREAIASGRDVQVLGIGWFRNVYRHPIKGRNKFTGEPVAIPAGRRIRFRPADSMKEAVAKSVEVFTKVDLEEKFGLNQIKQKPHELSPRSKAILLGERRMNKGKYYTEIDPNSIEDQPGGTSMEKYGVEIDPNKVPKEKKAGVGDKDPHPTTNIPLDPEKGSEPYEKKPEGKDGA